MRARLRNPSIAWALFACATLRAASVVDSVHNLSASGPGSVKATQEKEICIFCHTPHHSTGDTPLWNHSLSKQTYIVYDSPTMNAKVGQPNGASKLCLSCHDGTVALGMVNSRSQTIEMAGGATYMPSGPTNLGTDLSAHHPVSFTYDSKLAADDGKLKDPSTLTGKVKLDRSSQMQCTSCHNPHDNQFGNFLVIESTGSKLCTTCHQTSGATTASHATSSASLATMTTSSLTRAVSTTSTRSGSKVKRTAKTVAENGCNNCHAPHGGRGTQELLLTAREEQTCFTCHNGSVDQQNIQSEFNKASVHPVLQTSQLHKSKEDIHTTTDHVACADCHDSHLAKKTIATAARAAGPITGVKGITRTGATTESITQEYELCFRCHSDTTGRGKATVNRVSPSLNTREEFSTTSLSFHPVTDIGRNPNVPSLMSPLSASSKIKCTDCHNNDQGPGAGGAGPNGPHGSRFEPLLERQLITTDNLPESPENYALCYKCHSRDSILSDQSFRAMNSRGEDRGHRFHVVDQKTACTTCHDSHAASKSQHLINFNPEYVTPVGSRIEYRSMGNSRGSCTLTCHGASHQNASYPDALPGGQTTLKH